LLRSAPFHPRLIKDSSRASSECARAPSGTRGLAPCCPSSSAACCRGRGTPASRGALLLGRAAVPPRLVGPWLCASGTTEPTAPTCPLPDGVLVVHKPQNWTSFDVVAKVRNTLQDHLRGHGHKFTGRKKLKVGHGGTLDPMATGLLVIGVGKGCRALEGYLKGAKSYAAVAQLGSETDTQVPPSASNPCAGVGAGAGA